MSNYNMIRENQVEMVELSDKAMEAVSGGGTLTVTIDPERIPVELEIELPLEKKKDREKGKHEK